MKKLLMFALSLTVLLSIISCGGSQKQISTENRILTGDACIPDWYFNSPLQNKDSIYVIKTYDHMIYESSLELAGQEARNEIAITINTNIANKDAVWTKQIGGAASGKVEATVEQLRVSVTTESVKNAQVIKQKICERQEENKYYRAYVMVGYSKIEVDMKLLQAIKNDQYLYQEFKSSEAFKNFEEEIIKYKSLIKN